MKPEILQIGPMMPHVEAALAEAYTVQRLWQAADRAALLAERGPAIRGVATDGHHGCPADVWQACTALEIIASYGVGYDAIDIPACKARGVRVSNTPDVLNDAMAEITLGLIVALCRRIPQADTYVRAGRWASEGGFGLTGELTG
ncbi:MAG: 2-hydroxyacid dehydrogenase, partial [Pseudomonadota bacterium]